MNGMGEDQTLQTVRPRRVNLRLPLLRYALYTGGWGSAFKWSSNNENTYLFKYLLSTYWARKLICVHVFDIVFVVRHKWEVSCVTQNVTEKQFAEEMLEIYGLSFNSNTVFITEKQIDR